jgi:putative transposase
MPEWARIESLPEAFEVIKEMDSGRGWEKEARAAAREAVKRVLKEQMRSVIDQHLSDLESRGGEDRRNGSYERHLLTELGDIVLEVPRTRSFSAKGVIGAYLRRSSEVDRAVLACFVLGHSTRKVGEALAPLLGERVSATTVSRIAKTLDTAVAAYHARRLQDRYRALLLDGVVVSRRTGAGAIRRPVLVALGLLPDGRKEVIDYRLARSESEREWRLFLEDLVRRGLEGKRLDVVAIDGGKGLAAALTEVYSHVPVQRCWAHKSRNVTEKVRVADRNAVKRSVQAIYLAKNIVKARSAARRFAKRWQSLYPRAVECLRKDLPELLTFFSLKSPTWRKAVRTTNAIERRFRELRRRTRPMGAFSDRTSIDRILFAVFTHENQMQKIPTLFLLTQNR